MVHVDRNVTNAQLILTMVHEMMHIWNYDHNRGTTNWLAGFANFRHGFDFTTANTQENPNIAFHEGFAEYCGWELRHVLWGAPKPVPVNRARLAQGLGLANFAMVERNWIGVMTGLRLLTARDPYVLTFGLASGTPGEVRVGRRSRFLLCPLSPRLTFWDVLRVFQPNPDAGWPTAWQVGNRTFGLRRFFERASDIVPSFDALTRNSYIAILNPTSTVESRDRCTPVPPPFPGPPGP